MAAYNITLQATLLSESEGKWLVTSKGETDLPAAFIVDTAVKDALLSACALYNAHPLVFTACLRSHYKAIIAAVHGFETAAAAAAVPAEWASAPLIGITSAAGTPEEEPTAYAIKYVQPGEAARYLEGIAEPALYKALFYIIKDYSANPALWYFVLTRYLSKFKAHIESESEEND